MRDSEIAFDIGFNIPTNLTSFSETCNYHWELRNLDGEIIKSGLGLWQGDSYLIITNKGFRRKLKRWNSGKLRAFVLNDLHPHREYILWASFSSNTLKTDMLKMASFTIEDRTSYHLQLFLILFTIFATLFFVALFRGCGMEA